MHWKIHTGESGEMNGLGNYKLGKVCMVCYEHILRLPKLYVNRDQRIKRKKRAKTCMEQYMCNRGNVSTVKIGF